MLPFSPFQGMKVYKEGRTTGVTAGDVSATCLDEVVKSISNTAEGMFLCATEVTGASSGPGDSGGPVFYPPVGGDPPWAIGILSASRDSTHDGQGRCTSVCSFLFTPWAKLQTRMDVLFNPSETNFVASISGPTAVDLTSISCSWTATTDMNYPSYAWYIGAQQVGSGQTVSQLNLTYQTSFTLDVLISNSAGHSASTSINVDVDAGNPGC